MIERFSLTLSLSLLMSLALSPYVCLSLSRLCSAWVHHGGLVLDVVGSDGLLVNRL